MGIADEIPQVNENIGEAEVEPYRVLVMETGAGISLIDTDVVQRSFMAVPRLGVTMLGAEVLAANGNVWFMGQMTIAGFGTSTLRIVCAKEKVQAFWADTMAKVLGQAEHMIGGKIKAEVIDAAPLDFAEMTAKFAEGAGMVSRSAYQDYGRPQNPNLN